MPLQYLVHAKLLGGRAELAQHAEDARARFAVRRQVFARHEHQLRLRMWSGRQDKRRLAEHGCMATAARHTHATAGEARTHFFLASSMFMSFVTPPCRAG